MFLLYVLVSGLLCSLYVQLRWTDIEKNIPMVSSLGLQKNTVSLLQFLFGPFIFPVVFPMFLKNVYLKCKASFLAKKHRKMLVRGYAYRNRFEIILFDVTEDDVFYSAPTNNKYPLGEIINTIIYDFVNRKLDRKDGKVLSEMNLCLVIKDGEIDVYMHEVVNKAIEEGWKVIVTIKDKQAV